MSIDDKNSIWSLETIIIDNNDDEDKNGGTLENQDNVVIVDKDDASCMISEKNNNIKKKQTHQLHQNKLLAQFMEKCLKLENSPGMLRVLNKTLLSIYNESNNEFKKSQQMQKILTNAINNLELDPNHKYSHVKSLCEALKPYRLKKRVKLTTLAKNLKGRFSQIPERSKRRSENVSDSCFKKTKIDVIDLDDLEQTILPSINLDEYLNDVILVDDANEIQEKENINSQSTITISNYNKVIVLEEVEMQYENNETKNNSEKQLNNEEVETCFSNNKTENVIDNELVLNNEEIEKCFNNKETEDVIVNELVQNNKEIVSNEIINSKLVLNPEKIKNIEKEITLCKKKITELDEQEVVDDTVLSPYILSEKYKSRIVALYKELCQLTGDEAVKRREVHLNVLKGHPSEPVKILEKFINKNIGSNGVPPFPDFCDVVFCVTRANERKNLGWTKSQIMNEASALFVQCGRALQKRRQDREWRDLMSKIKEEDRDKDPADEDPELLAQLELNRRIAFRKEAELMERFTMMQYMPNSTSLVDSIIETNKREMLSLNDCKEKTRVVNNSQNIVSSYNIEEETANLKEKQINRSNESNNVENQVIHNTEHKSTETKTHTENSDNKETKTKVSSNNIEDKSKNLKEREISTSYEFDNNREGQKCRDTIRLIENSNDILNIAHECSINTENKTVNNNQKGQLSAKSIRQIENNSDTFYITSEGTIDNENKTMNTKYLLNNFYKNVDTDKRATDINNEILECSNNTDYEVKIITEDFDLVMKQEFPSYNMSASTSFDISKDLDKESDITIKEVIIDDDATKNDSYKSTPEFYDIESVLVKKEPGVNTLRLLEQLGTEYTTAIVDIEDPFLIIDISSDSSDSDDER